MNPHYLALIQRLDDAYRARSGEGLPGPHREGAERYEWLHRDAPFALLAHGTEDDPVFMYANQCAQTCFGYSFAEFIELPSRLSASSADRPERERLLQIVTANGIAHGYQGIRVHKTGEPFTIYDGVVWELLNEDGTRWGQAALFWPEPDNRPQW